MLHCFKRIWSWNWSIKCSRAIMRAYWLHVSIFSSHASVKLRLHRSLFVLHDLFRYKTTCRPFSTDTSGQGLLEHMLFRRHVVYLCNCSEIEICSNIHHAATKRALQILLNTCDVRTAIKSSFFDVTIGFWFKIPDHMGIYMEINEIEWTSGGHHSLHSWETRRFRKELMGS